MQLKSGSSVWLRGGAILLGQGELACNIKCDVAILGTGITGALLAQHLTAAGVDVVALDRREVCQGSTSVSTGLIQYELDTTLMELVQLRGEAEAFAAYRVCFDALAEFREYLEGLGISDGVEARESLYLAVQRDEVRGFREERQARQACGIKVRFLAEGELLERFEVKRPGALWSPGALSVDPYKTGAKLMAKAVRTGLRLHSPTGVVGYEADEHGVTLRTDKGFEVRAKKVMFATGYETPTFLDVPVKLQTSYAFASQPGVAGAGWHPGCMMWESARPYLYVRAAPEGRAIVGGADTPWVAGKMEEGQVACKAQELLGKFGHLFPGVQVSPEYAWSGVFAETEDGLPYIGSTQKFPHGFFALGYGGNGILFSFIAARIIRDLFVGRPCGHAGLFRFDRG